MPEEPTWFWINTKKKGKKPQSGHEMRMAGKGLLWEQHAHGCNNFLPFKAACLNKTPASPSPRVSGSVESFDLPPRSPASLEHRRGEGTLRVCLPAQLRAPARKNCSAQRSSPTGCSEQCPCCVREGSHIPWPVGSGATTPLPWQLLGDTDTGRPQVARFPLRGLSSAAWSPCRVYL